MNFQAVQQANGQNVTMQGMITEFKDEGVNPKSQKPYKKVAITDASGVKHNVTLRGTLPEPTMLNVMAQFALSSYQGVYQDQPYTGFSGFWNNQAQLAPQVPTGQAQPAYAPPQAPAQPAYAPPAPPARTYTPAVPANNVDVTRLSIERQAMAKAACDRFSGMDVPDSKVMGLIELLDNYVKTGKAWISGNEDGLLDAETPVTEEQAQAGAYTAPDDSIPF